jgi:hypothetical protein
MKKTEEISKYASLNLPLTGNTTPHMLKINEESANVKVLM